METSKEPDQNIMEEGFNLFSIFYALEIIKKCTILQDFEVLSGKLHSNLVDLFFKFLVKCYYSNNDNVKCGEY